MTVSTLILKPTKLCNADCSYCSSPIDGSQKWSLDDFKRVLDNLACRLSASPMFIWHGGEPMLMGPDFYSQCYEYAQSILPNSRFSMQTNLLLYKSKWKDVFINIMEGRISTSYDPDKIYRTLKGDPIKYDRVFWRCLNELIADGIHPLVIGTYSESSSHLAHNIYETARSRGENGFDIRVNYRFPAGRNADLQESITPKTYGRILVELYDKWLNDDTAVRITPLDQMLKITLTGDNMQCPWTNSCGGHFLGIEPNGDVYNCSEFADLGDLSFKFGNIFDGSIGRTKRVNFIHRTTRILETSPNATMLLDSSAARRMKARRFILPNDCRSCRHFNQCQGGCMRDAELFNRGLGGKFYYCESWKMVFDRIKTSIASGEADRLIERLGISKLQTQHSSLPTFEMAYSV